MYSYSRHGLQRWRQNRSQPGRNRTSGRWLPFDPQAAKGKSSISPAQNSLEQLYGTAHASAHDVLQELLLDGVPDSDGSVMEEDYSSGGLGVEGGRDVLDGSLDDPVAHDGIT